MRSNHLSLSKTRPRGNDVASPPHSTAVLLPLAVAVATIFCTIVIYALALMAVVARLITGSRWSGPAFLGSRQSMELAKPGPLRVAPSTPANPRRKGSSRSSTPSRPSARPARPISAASTARAGASSKTYYDDGGLSGATTGRPALYAKRRPKGSFGQLWRGHSSVHCKPLASSSGHSSNRL